MIRHSLFPCRSARARRIDRQRARRPVPGRPRLPILLLLVLVVRGCKGELDAPSATEAELLGPQGKASLQSILETANLSDLRWPDFSDYRGDVTRFYEAYRDALPWVRQMQATPEALAMIAVLRNAGEKGLSAEDYDGSRWPARLAHLRPATREPEESDLVRFDVALTVSAMRYISDLHVGRVNPRRLDFEVDVSKRRYDLPEFLRQNVVHASDLRGLVQQIEPPYPGYQRTIQALARYREMARLDDGEILPVVQRPIQPGDAYPGVPRLIRLLRLVGDLPEGAALPSGDTVYQGALVDAIKSFQLRNGLTPDGRIDAATVAELNVPLGRRVRQMELTLERWRWLPDEYQHSPIVVNIPEFRLRAYDDQFKIAVTMKVVVGKVYGQHETPIFMSQMRSVIFRPYWNVPPSIAKAEIIPALKRNPNYLAKENMEVVDRDENVVASSGTTDEILKEVGEGKLSFRQRPGPENSLGLIKFIFPNEFDVYMHDTPAAELFSKSRRDFSHGCIRLERPVDLAVWVLRNNRSWDVDHIRAAMNGARTEEVTLAHPISVLIVYGTVIVSEDGLVHFYDDIYGHDAALERALDQGYPYPR
jgi:L,D-transpeptidase YcbB